MQLCAAFVCILLQIHHFWKHDRGYVPRYCPPSDVPNPFSWSSSFQRDDLCEIGSPLTDLFSITLYPSGPLIVWQERFELTSEYFYQIDTACLIDKHNMFWHYQLDTLVEEIYKAIVVNIHSDNFSQISVAYNTRCDPETPCSANGCLNQYTTKRK